LLSVLGFVGGIAPYAKAANKPDDCAGARADYYKAYMKDVQRQAELANQGTPLLKKINQLSGLAKDPHKPIDSQLTTAELDKFNRLVSQLRYLQSEQLVSSGHVRDLKIVWAFCKASLKLDQLRNDYIETRGQLGKGYSEWLKAKAKGVYQKVLLGIGFSIPSDALKLMERGQKMRATLTGKH